jgi:hypothetical protein
MLRRTFAKLSDPNRGETGQAALEFMLMLPLFMIFLAIMIDFGASMYGYVSIANAAREGARYGAVNCLDGSCTDAEIQQRALTRSGGFMSPDLDAGEVTVSWPEGRDRGDSVVVSISHVHELMFFAGLSWTIKSCAEMPLERDEAGDPSGSGC